MYRRDQQRSIRSHPTSEKSDSNYKGRANWLDGSSMRWLVSEQTGHKLALNLAFYIVVPGGSVCDHRSRDCD